MSVLFLCILLGGSLKFIAIPSRGYSPATAYADTPSPASTYPSSSSLSSYGLSSPSTYRGSSSTTPGIAQSYLTEILHLPPHRQFPPSLALQILTHKSYRFTHIPDPNRLVPSPTPAEQDNWAANHNARLTFLGRRAIQSYLAMFIHSAIASSGTQLKNLDLLRGKGLEERLEIIRHTYMLGRMVGSQWDVEKYIRWDGNQVIRFSFQQVV